MKSLFYKIRRKLGLHRKRRMSSADGAALNNLVRSDPVLSNALRLMQDADILYRYGRYSSVVALAVLSLEEIGKYLIREWSSADPNFWYDKRKLHQMKQAAVAALFMIDGARRTYKKRNINFAELHDPEKMRGLVDAIMDGFESEKTFANAVKRKAIEAVKWSGIYYDEQIAEKGIEPSKITAENARELMENCSKAFMILADAGNIKLAALAFPMIYSDPKRKVS
jgi:AbiV family abortive infection protein